MTDIFEETDVVQSPDSEAYAKILIVKVKALAMQMAKVEASQEKLLDEIKQVLEKHIDHCWENMREHDRKIAELKEAKAADNAIMERKRHEERQKPHWHEAKAAYAGLILALLLFLKEIIAYFKGTH
jgi:hypothetical protein